VFIGKKIILKKNPVTVNRNSGACIFIAGCASDRKRENLANYPARGYSDEMLSFFQRCLTT